MTLRDVKSQKAIDAASAGGQPVRGSQRCEPATLPGALWTCMLSTRHALAACMTSPTLCMACAGGVAFLGNMVRAMQAHGQCHGSTCQGPPWHNIHAGGAGLLPEVALF